MTDKELLSEQEPTINHYKEIHWRFSQYQQMELIDSPDSNKYIDEDSNFSMTGFRACYDYMVEYAEDFAKYTMEDLEKNLDSLDGQTEHLQEQRKQVLKNIALIKDRLAS